VCVHVCEKLPLVLHLVRICVCMLVCTEACFIIKNESCPIFEWISIGNILASDMIFRIKSFVLSGF